MNDEVVKPAGEPAETGSPLTTPAVEPVTEPIVEPVVEKTAEPVKEPEKVAEPKPVAATEEETPDRVVPKADEYKLPDGVPEHVAQFAHDNDLTQDQLDKTLETFGGYMNSAGEAQKAAVRKAGEDFVQSWGKDKDQNLALAQRGLKQNDPDGLLAAYLDETGAGDHPVVLGFLHRLGSSMKEGGFIESRHIPTKGQKTAAQQMFGDSHPSTVN